MASNFKKAFSMGPWGIPWCHLCGKWADGAHLGVKKHKEYMADFHLKPWPESDLKPLPDEDDDEEKDKSTDKAKGTEKNTNGLEHIHEMMETFIADVRNSVHEAIDDAFNAGFVKGKGKGTDGLPQKSRSRSPKRFFPPT